MLVICTNQDVVTATITKYELPDKSNEGSEVICGCPVLTDLSSFQESTNGSRQLKLPNMEAADCL